MKFFPLTKTIQSSRNTWFSVHSWTLQEFCLKESPSESGLGERSQPGPLYTALISISMWNVLGGVVTKWDLHIHVYSNDLSWALVAPAYTLSTQKQEFKKRSWFEANLNNKASPNTTWTIMYDYILYINVWTIMYDVIRVSVALKRHDDHSSSYKEKHWIEGVAYSSEV